MARRRGRPASVPPGTHVDKISALTDAIAHVDPESSNAFFEAFRLIDAMMPTMEEELRGRWPDKQTEPHDIGTVCFPTVPVRTSAELYRAHVREQLSRIDESKLKRKPGETRPYLTPTMLRSLAILTRAELLGITSAASLRHPLRHSDVVMMEVLLREIMPDSAAKALGESEAHGASLLEEVRRDIAERLVMSPERKELVG